MKLHFIWNTLQQLNLVILDNSTAITNNPHLTHLS